VFEPSEGRDEPSEATMNLLWSIDNQERNTTGGPAGQQAGRLPFRPPRL
jgi:hypothetical protein